MKDEKFDKLLNNKKYRRFIDPEIYALFKFYQNHGYKYNPLRKINAFLHNIYYKNLSKSYKIASKCLKLNDLTLDVEINDARQALKYDKNIYNYIFLDAFAPAKCPALWTVDFLKLLHKNLDNNGMILTYSNAASIRNAFIQAGFWVGKIYNKENDKFIGTIATKNLELIKNGLSEYDLGLINSKAGIVYRDANLNLQNEAIIEEHEKRVATSDLLSSSKFIKTFRGSKNV